MVLPIHSAKAIRWPWGVRFPGVALAGALTAFIFIAPFAFAQASHDHAAPVQASTAPTASKPDAKKAKASYEQGIEAEKHEDWDTAYTDYSDAVNYAPNERSYAIRRELAKSRLVQSKVDAGERDAVAGKFEEARRELLGANYIDPSNAVVTERLRELLSLQQTATKKTEGANLSGELRLSYETGKRSFNYRGDTEGAYEELGRQFGVEVAFDVDLHARQVHFQIDDVDFPTAARLLGDMTGTFWQPLSARLFFVTENTPQKRKDYEASALRTVVLPASETPDQMTEVLRLVRDVAGITRSDLDTGNRTMTLRASPSAIAVATDLIDNLERPVGEIVLEIEILDVDRDFARQLGITPPQSSQVFTLSSAEIAAAQASYAGLINVIQQVFGSSLGSGSLIPPLVAFGGGKSTFLATLPGASANFSDMLSLVHSGRRILLRAQDGQPATFFAGERFPVSLNTFSPSLVAGAASGTALISPITNYPAGTAPSFVTTTSLRDNGFFDLVVANSGDNTISVLLGDGLGVFATQVTYPTGNEPVWIATGQFNDSTTITNSDSFVDLAVANKVSNTVSILLGNGDGTFQAKTDIPTGNAPVSVVTADFHDMAGNGFVDLAVANQADNSISIFQGNGDGTFKTPALIQLPGGYEPSALATADLNNDGHVDLIVADKGNNSVSVFLGNGDGTFQARTDYATGNEPVYVAIGDFNGDGAQDIAVANNGAATSTTSGNSVTIYYNQVSSTSVPVGTFVPGPTRDFLAGGGPTSIAVADVDVDGSADLVVSDETDNAVTILLNAGNQTFTALPELPVGTAPVSITTADFNGDSRADVAVANSGTANTTVILNSTSLFGAGSAAVGAPFPGVQYLDIGMKAKATPRIHSDNDVTLQLSFDFSSVSTQSYNSIPVINNQAIDQTVRLKANQTAVVATFLQSQLTNAITGTPEVADVPGVGLFDQDQSAQQQGNELLILVTPRMVRLAPREDREIYAGQGSLEGGTTGGAPALPPPAQPAAPPPPPAGAGQTPPPLPGVPRIPSDLPLQGPPQQ